jgi:hypothetical protein
MASSHPNFQNTSNPSSQYETHVSSLNVSPPILLPFSFILSNLRYLGPNTASLLVQGYRRLLPIHLQRLQDEQ